MPEELAELWTFAPIVAVLLVALWIWHKVMIDKLEVMAEKIERERDDWKKLAFALMAKCDIDLPAELLPDSTSLKKKEK
jgi:hypothetical protein